MSSVWVPPLKDGKRTYGQWAGNPDGHTEKNDRCVAEVKTSVGWGYCQCSRPRGHGPAGMFCKQHGKADNAERAVK